MTEAIHPELSLRSEKLSTASGVVRIYAAGGCGINLAAMIGDLEPQIGISGTDVVYVDTSASNLYKVGKNAKIYALEGVDGSGKVRRENSSAIADKIGDLLLEHRPRDLNVVVFSASGGSGSVFGPLIVKALLERDEAVVAFVVGSTESAITATNTLNTLKSMDVISTSAKAPVVMFYTQNPPDVPRSEIDKSVVTAINALLVLGSKQNEGLDTRDLKHFLRYDRACRAQPQLSLMEIVTTGDPKTISGVGVNHIISLASVFRSTDALPLAMKNEYQCTGYLPVECQQWPHEEIHFIVHTDELPAIVKAVNESVKEYEQFATSRPKAIRVVGDEETDADSGLIL